MTALAWLIPAALTLGGLGLLAFLWSLKTGQYEDLDGAAWRALEDDEPESVQPTTTTLDAIAPAGTTKPNKDPAG